MVVLDSFKRSLLFLKDNPLILVLVFVLLVFGSLGSLFRVIDARAHPWVFPLTALVFMISFLIGPFFMGGIYGMVIDSGKSSELNLSTFISRGKRHYVSLLVAMVLFFLLILSVVVGLGVGGAAAVIALKGLHISPWVLSPIFFLFTSALFAVLFFFLQFYDIGIVADGYNVLETFKRSAAFVWRRKLAVLGYSIVTVLLLTMMMAPNFALSYRQTMQARQLAGTGARPSPFTPMPIETVLLSSAINIILGTIAMSIHYVYHAMFYLQLTERVNGSSK